MKYYLALVFLPHALFCSSTAQASIFGNGVNVFSMDFVSLYNFGNHADSHDGDNSTSGNQFLGSVDHWLPHRPVRSLRRHDQQGQIPRALCDSA